MNEIHVKKSSEYLNELCVNISNRSVGSLGNIAATNYFKRTVSLYDWDIEEDEMDVMDWFEGSASLTAGKESFIIKGSPYSTGCSLTQELTVVRSIEELEKAEISNKAVLLIGEIAAEQLMPKNFIFYNPDEHRKIISMLENKNPCVIICATGRNSSLAGGVYPFPLIEDGDFSIPSVYMTDIEGERLAAHRGRIITVNSTAERISSKAYNITAKKQGYGSGRIVITAHIDAKKGTPGAIDNGTGVVVLMLLGELLKDYTGKYSIEMVALNGEDYYAVSGQMKYISKNEGKFDDILIDINIDGAGYIDGDTAFSFYGVPDNICGIVNGIIDNHENISTGTQWPQGDHSIFVQFGVPAIAVSSMWFTENINNQEITHTEKDRPEIADCTKIAEIAVVITEIISSISNI